MSTLDILSEDEQFMVRTVRDFVDSDVRPVARELEHTDTYPDALIERMKQLGVFGLAVPEEYGGTPVSMPCYVLITEELARGWMSLAGAMGGHTVVAKLLLHFGTDEQKRRCLPGMAGGEIRATMALTEPGGGSDLQAMRTVAREDAGGYVINGAKTWITNSRRSQLIALLCKTDPEASPAHKGISILLVEQRQVLASGGDDGAAHVWNTHEGEIVRSVRGHREWVLSVALTQLPSGAVLLATGGKDGIARIWGAKTGAALRTVTGRGRAVNSVAWASPPGREPWLVTGSDDATVRVWDANSGAAERVFPAGTAGVDLV
ncbi:acyl-CoA dehydrogenase family protein [Streptomyces blattellae]|uniref:acyl-CoA dehydrogenase family protein n=1 Tax=Streptomyces blattellae TaxID=2569855 RepID=UPI0018ACD1DE|nr:acyl-CoA dehydrogenase family protein [Streptomyces blattellae]